MARKLYECYCERTKKAQYVNDNFSIIISCNKRPSKKKLEELLYDKLNGYHICYVTSDICFDISGSEIVEVTL